MSIVPFNLQKNLIINASGNMICIDARQPFTIKINTIYGNGNNTFALPLTDNTTNLKIETSDGQLITITNYADSVKLIQFPSAGIYTIKMRGECGWAFNNTGDCQKLIGISNWGRLEFNNLHGGFHGCINLGLNEGLPTSGAINAPSLSFFMNLFHSCNLSTIADTTFSLCVNATVFQAVLYNNKLTNISGQLLKYNTKLDNLRQAFSVNLIKTIGIGLLDNCPLMTNMYATFAGNLIESIPDDIFKKCININTFFSCFAVNKIKYLPYRLFYYNINVTNYASVFTNAIDVGCVLPNEIFYLDSGVIGKITTFQQLFYQDTVAKSPTGTVQDIWNYASPTAIKTNAFLNCTGLANYLDIPVDWRT